MRKPYYNEYHRMANKNKISIKLNPEERALIEIGMIENGWENLSSYIKYKLFGWELSSKRNAIISEKKTLAIPVILNSLLLDLLEHIRYFTTAFDKEIEAINSDSTQEEKTKIEKKMDVAMHWSSHLKKRVNALIALCTSIANKLDIDTPEILTIILNDKISELFHPGDKFLIIKGRLASDPIYLEKIQQYSVTFISKREISESMKELTVYICHCKAIPKNLKKGDLVHVSGPLAVCMTKTKDGRINIENRIQNGVVRIIKE